MTNVRRHSARRRLSFRASVGTAVVWTAYAVTALSAQAAETPLRRPPNIVFIITDDQFKHMMNFLPEGKGKNLTPHTDRLAAEGTVMLQQYVTSPVCTPSRFACLTGTYPSRSRAAAFLRDTEAAGGQTVVQWNTFITPETMTLPKRLRDAGYATGIVGKNHVVDVPGWEQPPRDGDPADPDIQRLLQANRAKQVEACRKAGFDYAASLYFNNPNENGIEALAVHNLDWIVDGALDFIDRYKDRPFFLYFATTVPHGPREHDRSWNADPRITADGMQDVPPAVLPPRSSIPKRLTESGVGTSRSKWSNREDLLWLDDAVGAVVSRLEAHGLDDKTIIVYFNDHGQRSKGTLYQGGVHAESFVWKKGGFPVGPTVDARVSNVDFAPTILDLAGIADDADVFDGISFLPLLQGETATPREAMYFELGYLRGILKDEWKYIALRYPDHAVAMTRAERKRILDDFNAYQVGRGRPVHHTDPMLPFSHVQLIPGGGDAEQQSMGKYPGFNDPDQLYNLAADPNEQHNLARDPKYAETLASLKQELEQRLTRVPGRFGEFGGIGADTRSAAAP